MRASVLQAGTIMPCPVNKRWSITLALDAQLRTLGLPPMDQLFARPAFAVDYRGSDPIEPDEAEVVAEEVTAKK